jgi:hypothetical protein
MPTIWASLAWHYELNSVYLTITDLTMDSLKALCASRLLSNSLALDVENHRLVRSNLMGNANKWISRSIEQNDMLRKNAAEMNWNWLFKTLVTMLIHASLKNMRSNLTVVVCTVIRRLVLVIIG